MSIYNDRNPGGHKPVRISRRTDEEVSYRCERCEMIAHERHVFKTVACRGEEVNSKSDREHACPDCDAAANAVFRTRKGLEAHAYFEHAGATVEELEDDR